MSDTTEPAHCGSGSSCEFRDGDICDRSPAGAQPPPPGPESRSEARQGLLCSGRIHGCAMALLWRGGRAWSASTARTARRRTRGEVVLVSVAKQCDREGGSMGDRAGLQLAVCLRGLVAEEIGQATHRQYRKVVAVGRLIDAVRFHVDGCGIVESLGDELPQITVRG